MLNKDISCVTKEGLCMGCGLCEDSCLQNAIKMQLSKGIYTPLIDRSSCNSCGLCFKVCPGKGCDIGASSNELFTDKQIRCGQYIGRYLSCYVGYSNSYEIRYHGASGGLVSQTLIYLLEKGIITGAAVVGFSLDDPMRPLSYIAKTREQILSARSSKYCVVSYDTIAKQILDNEGKYVVVGLPCHIQAFRNYEKIFKLLKDRVIGYFSLYCSATKNLKSQDYLLYRYSVRKDKISLFSYRDEGYMGSMIAKDKNGNRLMEVEYLKYYMPMRGFFNLYRCSLCIDHFGELADVSFGDIYVHPYCGDKTGISSWVTRNRYWERIFEQMANDDVVSMQSIDTELLKQSQKYCFRKKSAKRIVTFFKIRQLSGKKNPEYDTTFHTSSFSMKYLVRILAGMVIRFIGRHRQLWWIIRLLDRSKD